jgi:hypothetical protein
MASRARAAKTHAKTRAKTRAKAPAVSRVVVPFPLPLKLSPNLARVRAYWEGLRRGENSMPFWDDVNLSSLPELSAKMMLVDVFAKPQRFRFSFIGPQLLKRYGDTIVGRFADEMEVKYPFDYFLSQASATVERGAPSHYAHGAGGKSRGSTSYTRLLLPMWGDGRIGMLLGAIG